MKWVDAYESFPSPGEEVLVCSEDTFNLAIFDGRRKNFLIKTSGVIIDPATTSVKWVRLTALPDMQ